MSTRLLLVGLCIAVLAIAVALQIRHTMSSEDKRPPSGAVSSMRASTITTSIPALKVPTKAERLDMSNEDRIQLLEKLGCLPDDPDLLDYKLAEKTSWWGKKLDPKAFWANRVIWYDREAEWEARRRGRAWPPMPFEDPAVANRSNVDSPSDGSTYPYVRYVGSEREAAFWDLFQKTHPHPPETIQSWLEHEAARYTRFKYLAAHEPEYAARLRLSDESLQRSLQSSLHDAKQMGYPSEALAEESLQWAYVLVKRAEYAKMLDALIGPDSRSIANFFTKLYVDKKYIVEPLSDENLKAANAWKIAYLRRLRTQKTDESYINAYLAAWNLSAQEVFGSPSQ